MRHKNLRGSTFKPMSMDENDQKNFYKMEILQNTQNSLKPCAQISLALTSSHSFFLLASNAA